MSNIKLFHGQKIRSHWDAGQEQWFFSVIDVVGALTVSANPRKYWSVLKTRLKKEGRQLATNCSQLKIAVTNGRGCSCPEMPDNCRLVKIPVISILETTAEQSSVIQ